jgi:hypothetical protein
MYAKLNSITFADLVHDRYLCPADGRGVLRKMPPPEPGEE